MSPTPPAVLIIPGLRVGCTPYYALAQSTLECLFDSACINTTAYWISRLPSSSWPKPLNSSLLSKYSISEQVQTIYDQMMTDQWEIAKTFSNYYAICAPVECTYTYIARFDLLYLITMLVGLFGGLTIALRSVSPFLVQLFFHSRALYTKCWEQRCQRSRVHPSVATNDLRAPTVRTSNTQLSQSSEGVLVVTTPSLVNRPLCTGLYHKVTRLVARCKTFLTELNIFEVRQ